MRHESACPLFAENTDEASVEVMARCFWGCHRGIVSQHQGGINPPAERPPLPHDLHRLQIACWLKAEYLAVEGQFGLEGSDLVGGLAEAVALAFEE
jgi:hypothetical protein